MRPRTKDAAAAAIARARCRASPGATAASTEPKRSVVTSRSRSAPAKPSMRSPARRRRRVPCSPGRPRPTRRLADRAGDIPTAEVDEQRHGLGRAFAEPLAGRLALAGVVVVATAGDRRGVVARPSASDPPIFPPVSTADGPPLDHASKVLPDRRTRANSRPCRAPRRRVNSAGRPPGALSVPKPQRHSSYPRLSQDRLALSMAPRPPTAGATCCHGPRRTPGPYSVLEPPGQTAS